MNLNEIDFDEEDVTEDTSVDPNIDEDNYVKPWLDGNQGNDPKPNTDDSNPQPADPEPDEDVLTSLLRDKGINPESVKIQNEAGDIEEKSFNDLTREEQLQILNYDNSSEDYGLEDSEVDLINELRTNNLSVEEYKNYIAKKAVKDYLTQAPPEASYEVDSIQDDELYVLDLKAKIPELTDEDAAAELELAKQNEALYQKKVQGIRNEYKKKEELVIAQEEADQKQAAEQATKEFEDSIVTTIQENDTIDLGGTSLALSEDDMNEIASFILDSDVAGVRHIAKALNDPKTLVGMVWYALKGQEAFSQVSGYYKQKMTETAKYNYTKGYDDAKAGVKPNTAKTVVKKPTSQQKSATPQQRTISINDLD